MGVLYRSEGICQIMTHFETEANLLGVLLPKTAFPGNCVGSRRFFGLHPSAFGVLSLMDGRNLAGGWKKCWIFRNLRCICYSICCDLCTYRTASSAARFTPLNRREHEYSVLLRPQ